MAKRLCAWGCGRLTDRHCRICVQCCDQRDAYDRRVDEGSEKYVPPDKRPEYAQYYPKKPKRERTASQAESLRLARASAPRRPSVGPRRRRSPVSGSWSMAAPT